jgi:hypothetical protein
VNYSAVLSNGNNQTGLGPFGPSDLVSPKGESIDGDSKSVLLHLPKKEMFDEELCIIKPGSKASTRNSPRGGHRSARHGS